MPFSRCLTASVTKVGKLTINVSVMDGCNVIGGSKILVGFDGKNILFDFGTNYKYQQELLRLLP